MLLFTVIRHSFCTKKFLFVEKNEWGEVMLSKSYENIRLSAICIDDYCSRENDAKTQESILYCSICGEPLTPKDIWYSDDNGEWLACSYCINDFFAEWKLIHERPVIQDE